MAPTLDDERLDATFAALADRTRRDIVARLSHGEATVTELAAPYPMSLQAVSQHIRVLEVLGTAVSWMEESRRLWADRMDRLEAHLAQVQEDEAP